MPVRRNPKRRQLTDVTSLPTQTRPVLQATDVIDLQQRRGAKLARGVAIRGDAMKVSLGDIQSWMEDRLALESDDIPGSVLLPRDPILGERHTGDSHFLDFAPVPNRYAAFHNGTRLRRVASDPGPAEVAVVGNQAIVGTAQTGSSVLLYDYNTLLHFDTVHELFAAAAVVNTTVTPFPGSSQVYADGRRISPDDFTVSGTTHTISLPVDPSRYVRVVYQVVKPGTYLIAEGLTPAPDGVTTSFTTAIVPDDVENYFLWSGSVLLERVGAAPGLSEYTINIVTGAVEVGLAPLAADQFEADMIVGDTL